MVEADRTGRVGPLSWDCLARSSGCRWVVVVGVAEVEGAAVDEGARLKGDPLDVRYVRRAYHTHRQAGPNRRSGNAGYHYHRSLHTGHEGPLTSRVILFIVMVLVNT